MDVVSITEYIESTFDDIHIVTAWGETSFFYNPHRKLPRGIYFATIKEKNGPNDRASNLDRSDVFRLNIGISKWTYRTLLGQQPSRPQAGGVIDTGHDFAALDQLFPHPVYGWMSWVAVLNPRPPRSRPSSPCYLMHTSWRSKSSLSEQGKPDDGLAL